ncbi:hypothetical protein Leryth_007298 [Lithospermum erythrorhizon]|nr:hypothetical protein Leryth_007298 [Lithospermum erythrorhizon]
MEEITSALNAQMDQMADLVEKLSAELRSGFTPAYNNFMGFFHAIDWKEPWLMGLISFHVLLLLVTFISRRNINFQMCLFLLACRYTAPWGMSLKHNKTPEYTRVSRAVTGVYLAEKLNSILSTNWKSFATQNYFDRSGLFFSVVWSGPLLVIAMIILVNTLFSLCYLIVKWKRSELRHRARQARNKED